MTSRRRAVYASDIPSMHLLISQLRTFTAIHPSNHHTFPSTQTSRTSRSRTAAPAPPSPNTNEHHHFLRHRMITYLRSLTSSQASHALPKLISLAVRCVRFVYVCLYCTSGLRIFCTPPPNILIVRHAMPCHAIMRSRWRIIFQDMHACQKKTHRRI
jgi:hypothetical protein